MTKKLLTNQFWNFDERDRYGTDIKDNLEGYLENSIDYLQKLYNKLTNEGWSGLSLEITPTSGYSDDYSVQILVIGSRLETDKEYLVRTDKDIKERERKRKQTKDNRAKEYALFLKLKEKYETTDLKPNG